MKVRLGKVVSVRNHAAVSVMVLKFRLYKALIVHVFVLPQRRTWENFL